MNKKMCILLIRSRISLVFLNIQDYQNRNLEETRQFHSSAAYPSVSVKISKINCNKPLE